MNGIVCGKCKQSRNHVIESRIHSGLRVRTRQCVCGFKWKTVEINSWIYIQQLEGNEF